MTRISTFRKHFLVILREANERNVNPESLRDRLRQTFACQSIIIAQRKDTKGLSFDYIIGVKCDDASKNTAEKTIRALFFEFEGMLCRIQFRKGSGPICLYLVSEDIILVFGSFSIESLIMIARATEKKKYCKCRKKEGTSSKKNKSVFSSLLKVFCKLLLKVFCKLLWKAFCKLWKVLKRVFVWIFLSIIIHHLYKRNTLPLFQKYLTSIIPSMIK